MAHVWELKKPGLFAGARDLAVAGLRVLVPVARDRVGVVVK